MTGCLGAKTVVRTTIPAVLAVTGPHACEDRHATAVHTHLPRPHDPFVDLVPPQGIKLDSTLRVLEDFEGCNHRCYLLHHSNRGDLVSRPVGEVLREAENLVQKVKELLMVPQDTSA